MARVLFAVTGSRHWTLNDGTQHPCGYWPEELAVPHEVFAAAGLRISRLRPPVQCHLYRTRPASPPR